MFPRIFNAALLSFLVVPTLAIPKPFNFFGAQEITPRANYLGGWPLALDGTGSACPSVASVQCDAGPYDTLNTQCCPSGNTCKTSILVAYCCPSGSFSIDIILDL